MNAPILASDFRFAESEAATAVQKKIQSFGQLSVGWHFGQGGPIGEEVIEISLLVYDHCVSLGLFSIDAFAGANGEILITLHRSEVFIEVIVQSPSQFILAEERDNEEVSRLEATSPKEVVQWLNRTAESIWNISAGFTQTTTIQKRSDSSPWHFEPAPLTLQYRLSKGNAWMDAA